MANVFKSPRFMMLLSILLGVASVGIAAYSLYKEEYVIGAALLFNVFICYTNYKAWKSRLKG